METSSVVFSFILYDKQPLLRSFSKISNNVLEGEEQKIIIFEGLEAGYLLYTFFILRSQDSFRRQQLDDTHIFHCDIYFVFGGIRTCLGVSSDPMFQWNSKIFSIEFAARSKPPSRDNHRKAFYPRTQQRDQGAS